MGKRQEFQGGPISSFRIERLETDVDTRILDLWREVLGIADDEWDLTMVAAFMRAAYGKGYCDALSESDTERGQLARDHGYIAPEQKPQIFPEQEQ